MHAAWAADGFPGCQSPLWDRIQGWQVVAAVLLIMAAWTLVQVARMHYMVRMAEKSQTPPPERPPDERPDG